MMEATFPRALWGGYFPWATNATSIYPGSIYVPEPLCSCFAQEIGSDHNYYGCSWKAFINCTKAKSA